MKINTPLTKNKISRLNVGDIVYLSGTVYTGRDLAHKRLNDSLNNSEELAFELSNQTIFYTGPTPNRDHQVIGSCGPTTSYRMDDLTNLLLDKGLSAMIGKGERNQNVINKIKETGAVYFISIGGVAALTSECIKEAQIICYEDLGPEAIRKLEVEDMKLIVAIDSKGNTIFENYKKYMR